MTELICILTFVASAERISICTFYYAHTLSVENEIKSEYPLQKN